MVSKPQQIIDAMARGDHRHALRIAASFPQLGKEKEAITRGWSACQRPEFYRQLGKDPETLIRLGAEAVSRRYLTPAE